MTNPENRPDGQGNNTVRVGKVLVQMAIAALEGRYEGELDDSDIIERLQAALTAEPESQWRPLDTAPYDKVVLFLSEEGHVFEGFIYDCGWREFAEMSKAVRWMPKPHIDDNDLTPPPAEQAAQGRNNGGMRDG